MALLACGLIDALRRRETRPKILWRTGKDKNQSQESSQNDASGNIPADVAAVTAAAMSKKPKAAARDEEAWLLSDRIDADEIRRRIKASIGVDPIEQSLVSKKERYLQRVVALLPPKDSAEREALRGQNKSLQHYIELMNMKQ